MKMLNKTVICLIFLSLLFVVFVGKSNADIYSWVDEKGVTHYSSTPPQSDTDLQVKILKTDKPTTPPGNSPIENIKSTLKSVVTPAPKKEQPQKPKVELYVTSWCPWCKKAEAFFRAKGIEPVIYDVERDKQAAQRKLQLDNNRGVPFAVINGKHYIKGYNEAGYNNALKQ